MTVHPRPEISLFNQAILRQAALDSVKKLAPQRVVKNPVMFVVEVGAFLTTLLWLRDLVAPAAGAEPLWFTGQVTLWLWFTVLFANLAEAVAEGRGKAQAAALKKMRREIMARKLEYGKEIQIPASTLRKGTSWWRRPETTSPATATSSKASPQWTSPQSPGSQPRSSGKPEETAPQ